MTMKPLKELKRKRCMEKGPDPTAPFKKMVKDLETKVVLLEDKVEYLMYQIMLLGTMHRWTHETAGGGLFGFGDIGRPSYEAMEQRAGAIYLETFGVKSMPDCPWPVLKKLVDERTEKLRKQFEEKMAKEKEKEKTDERRKSESTERGK